MARRRWKRTGRVPPELRRAYGARARLLGDAILSLLPAPPVPSSPAECRGCGGRTEGGCLVCRRWAHLLRDGDHASYRRLVTRAVCAVTPGAPAPPLHTPGNAGFSQSKLVNETIKWILMDRSCTIKHVLCNVFCEDGRSGRIRDLVSSSSWDILLRRIGDLLMCYILWHTSIFLSVRKSDYFQVTGPPLNLVLRKPAFNSTMPRSQQSRSKKANCAVCSLWHTGKRKQDMSEENCLNSSTFRVSSLEKSFQITDNEQSLEVCGAVKIAESKCSNDVCRCQRFPCTHTSRQCPKFFSKNSRKRKRLYSWQRRSKQKQNCCEDNSSTEGGKLNTNCANVGNLLSENITMSGDVTSDRVNSLKPAVADALAMNDVENNSQVKATYREAFISSAKSPIFMLNVRPSQDPSCSCPKLGIQSTVPQIGPPSDLHLMNGPICFNCLMLKASKGILVDSLISRQSIFYNRRSSYNVFHGDHILKKENKPDALSLIKHIFGIRGCCLKFLRCNCHGSATIINDCLCHCLLKLMNNLIRNSKRCQYKKLLLKHCPVKSKVPKEELSPLNEAKNDNKAQYSLEGGSTTSDQCFALLESYNRHQQVVSFVWAVLKRIAPEPLLGNSDSKRCLRKNIWKFIKLGRFENFRASDCIDGLKVSQYAWLSKIRFSDCFCDATRKETGLLSDKEGKKQKGLLHCWIGWLFSDIVIPLIQGYFYITERESKRYDVFYYLKSVWRKLTMNAITSLNGKNFRLLHGAFKRAVKQSFCSSRVRFLPKAKDMRPLVIRKTPSKLGILNKCHAVMKLIRDKNPEMFGSSVFGYNDIHQNLCQFISSIRSQSTVMPKIYIVVADVSKAFDSINQDMLLKIMEDVLKSNEYVMRRCLKVVCNRSTNAVYHLESNASISTGSASDFSIQLSSRGGIFVDQGTVSRIRKEELRRLLFEQVKHNVLKVGKKFYLQEVGIAQGGKLSPNLCSLYYGHLENTVISKYLHDAAIPIGEKVSTREYLLMRFIDDFMFISCSKKHATNFFNMVRRGFSKYNCYMNDTKYCFNFDVENSKHCHNRIYTGGDGVSFIPWSGLLINCETLEIQADYTRYSDITISSTITVKTHSSTQHLQRKLCHYMRIKCHPIFHDSIINSPGTVRLNIYQAFLLCAMKFHCYIRSMCNTNISPADLVRMITRTVRYTHSHIASQVQDAELYYNVPAVLKLRRKETIWLGLSAFIRVLRKKQSRYRDLLALLTAEIERCGRLDRTCGSLRYAVDDSHSSMFWKFKF